MSVLHPKTKEAYKLLHDGALALCRAEQLGLRIDVEKAERLKEELERKIEKLKEQALNTKLAKHWKHVYGSKFNLNSNHQLAHILYDVRKVKPVKLTKSGKGATDEEALKELNMPELDLIIEIRKLNKIRNTYLEAFLREQVNGVIHPFFNLHTVRTYRSSSDSPNFQNIPKRDKQAMMITRSIIYPREGHQFVRMDFSGIEVRMAACYTEDPQLIHDILHGDMHRDMAIELYKLPDLDKHHEGEVYFRQGAKNAFVFPQFYGDYYGNCAHGLLKWAQKAYTRDGVSGLEHLQKCGLVRLDKKGKVKDFEKFVEHVKGIEDQFWNVRYKVYNRWKEKVWKQYQKKGYIDMFTGFRCQGIMSKKDVTNYAFQGSAFHCLLKTFIRIDELAYSKGWDSFPVMQVHDEIVCDTNPKELKKVIHALVLTATKWLPRQWDWIKIPLEVEVEVGEVDRPLSEVKQAVIV